MAEISRTLLYLLLIPVGIYLLLLAALFLSQSRLLYLPDLPSRELTATPESIGMEFETLQLQTGDGVTLHGWYIPAQDDRGTLLFFHGNAGNISHRLESLQLFHHLGLNVLIFDYRGYGQSEGSPSERGTQQDALAAWTYLTQQRGESPERIVLFGRSLGAAIAGWLASQKEPGALILESTFISVPEMASELYWWLPARFLSRMRYDTRKALESVSCPVLVAHSPQDEIIPFHHGKALFEAAPEPKTFLRMQGDHNSGFLTSGENYRRTLAHFLEAHLP